MSFATLLKILSRITKPTNGQIRIQRPVAIDMSAFGKKIPST